MQLCYETEIPSGHRRCLGHLRGARHRRTGGESFDRLLRCVSVLKKSPVAILTGTSKYIAHLDGYSEIDGGWLNQHWIQLAYQLADSVAGLAYSFCGSCLILFLMNLLPGLGLRASEEAEVLGMDDAEIGEFAVSPRSVQSRVQWLIGCSMTTWSSLATLSMAMPSTISTPSTLANATPPWNRMGKRSPPLARRIHTSPLNCSACGRASLRVFTSWADYLCACINIIMSFHL